MRAVAITPGTTSLELMDLPTPALEQPDRLLIKVVRVGICGTDREIARGEIGEAPRGEGHLIIGHEMLGRVAAVGAQAQGFKEGDWVVATVRRGCGQCAACRGGHSDFCRTGDYGEHGIKGLHGFMAEYVVDDPAYVVRLPEDLAELGVLLEPLSVGEKALDQALKVLARVPDVAGARPRTLDAPGWGAELKALVAGSGPIGMLGAMILRAHGAEVTVVDRSDEESLPSQLIRAIGARHIDGRKVETERLDDQLGQVDLIFEATGAAQFSFSLIDALGTNGVYVMTGIPGDSRDVPLPAGSLMQQLVLKNQAVLGSVNANRAHFEQGVADLQRFRQLWGPLAGQLITERVPLERFMEAIEPQGASGIKSVVEIGG